MSSYVNYPEYKPSNIEWLGDIPKHWDVKQLRHVLSEPLSNGLFKKKEQWGKGYRIVNVFDVYVDGNVVDEKTLDRVNCSVDEYRKYSAQHGDFFCVRSSLKLEGVGKSAVVLAPIEQLVFECHLVRGRPDNTKTDPKYLCYFLNSEYSRNTLISLSNQVTMTTLDQEKFKSLGLSLPPLNEQKNIAHFLDYKTEQINALIAKLGGQFDKATGIIEKLKEYRSALITNAVTGKIDVRNVPIPSSGAADA